VSDPFRRTHVPLRPASRERSAGPCSLSVCAKHEAGIDAPSEHQQVDRSMALLFSSSIVYGSTLPMYFSSAGEKTS
jgi:hypothetical protein